MVILRSQNKIIDFLMILAWASPIKQTTIANKFFKNIYNGHDPSTIGCLFLFDLYKPAPVFRGICFIFLKNI